MEPVNDIDNTYVDFKKEVNDKDPKFKVGDHVIMLLMILMVKKLLEQFMKKNYKRLIKKNIG